MHKSLRYRLWTGGVVAIGVFSFLYPFVVPPPGEEVLHKPVHDTVNNIPDFSQHVSVVDKKKAFFNYIKPEVEKQNQKILEQRSFVLAFQERFRSQPSAPNTTIDTIELGRFKVIAKEYDVEVSELNEAAFDTLLQRVDVIPIELVLVQAANESAWGTSRFARLGFNFFGMWCYKKGCGFVPLRRSADMKHEVAKYTSLEEGVAKYLNTLNRHYAYADLRYIRSVLRETQQPITGEALAEGLLHYSERGQAYVEELQSMIRVNRKFM
ncbi:MAG: mannosyl-glycoprotein endo-beta-N-acetylglucosamidase [Alteromonadaceae bacterium]|nr:mannosyl-glycoprotein endo-beta-N-acetylglucosamidase [Alteromonadaceae bacterium]